MQGYLVVRIENEKGSVAQFAQRYRLQDPRFSDVVRLVGRHGFEVHHQLGQRSRGEWPLIAYAYPSPRQDGVGRAGGQLLRLSCRQIRCPRAVKRNLNVDPG